MTSQFDQRYDRAVTRLASRFGGEIRYRSSDGEDWQWMSTVSVLPETEEEVDSSDGTQVRRVRTIVLCIEESRPEYCGITTIPIKSTFEVGGMNYAYTSLKSGTAGLVDVKVANVGQSELSRPGMRGTGGSGYRFGQASRGRR